MSSPRDDQTTSGPTNDPSSGPTSDPRPLEPDRPDATAGEHDHAFTSEPDPDLGYEGMGEIRLRGRPGSRRGSGDVMDSGTGKGLRAEIDSGRDPSSGGDRTSSGGGVGWGGLGWGGLGGGGLRFGAGSSLPGVRGLRLLAGGLAFVLLLAVILAVVRRPPGRSTDAPPGGPGTLSFTLYFLDEQGELVAEAREMAAKASPAAQVHAVVAEELAGSMSGRGSPIPSGTQLLHLFVARDGLVTIDLSREVVRDHPRDMESEYATLSALVRIVRDNFSEFTGVQILIEGEPVPTLAGHFAIEGPLLGEEWR